MVWNHTCVQKAQLPRKIVLSIYGGCKSNILFHFQTTLTNYYLNFQKRNEKIVKKVAFQVRVIPNLRKPPILSSSSTLFSLVEEQPAVIYLNFNKNI